MVFVVPFDGSELSEAALVRASEFGAVLDERILAVTIVPNRNVEYARTRGWIGSNEPFDHAGIVSALHTTVTDLVPEANYRHELVDKHATSGTIATRLRTIAKSENASMVFLGSDNAGRLVTGIGSVGGRVASEPTYDVVIVRNRAQSRAKKLQEPSREVTRKSDFYR